MRLHRFYVSQPLGEEVVIDDVSVINQWSKVFRYTKGDFVILFNGDGSDYHYLIEDIQKKSCTLARSETFPSYIPKKHCTLFLSVIKKDNFELAVQKATELGVTEIVPVIASRSEKKNLSFERLDKIAIEASEQCGRGDVPIIKPIIDLKEALRVAGSTTSVPIFFEATTQVHISKLPKGVTSDNEPSYGIFIGPEGGWTSDEIALMSQEGLASYSLGETMLRAETAAIAACALLIL